jgi:glycosyltransferase involved in cell wall biosynthesis
MKVAAQVTGEAPHARVVVNGGNCPWPDVNWVHAVHAAWPVFDEGAPLWLRVKHRALKALDRQHERTGLRAARTVIVNSGATRRAIVEAGLASPDIVHTVYLGSDASWAPATPAERSAARDWLRVPPGEPLVAFVGALGFDVNKGFDVLWDAWRRLSASTDWRGWLVVAGAGGRLPEWQRAAARERSGARVCFLGQTTRVREVLAAADLLVSPVRYEAYGLNVQEALCRGAAVMVSTRAGIAERLAGQLDEALLPANLSGAALADRLRAWSSDVDGWRERASCVGVRLQRRSWDDMAADIVALATNVRHAAETPVPARASLAGA